MYNPLGQLDPDQRRVMTENEWSEFKSRFEFSDGVVQHVEILPCQTVTVKVQCRDTLSAQEVEWCELTLRFHNAVEFKVARGRWFDVFYGEPEAYWENGLIYVVLMRNEGSGPIKNLQEVFESEFFVGAPSLTWTENNV